jgi:radical SAM protein with 4Fe4S-binding SPASM domain
MYNNISRYSEKDIQEILSNELGASYIEYRKKWNSVTVDNPALFPIHIDFELNDKCNQICKMCPRNTKFHSEINYTLNTGRVLNFDDYKKIIGKCVPKGLMSVNLGAFAEPLIHKDIIQMVKYAHEKGIIDSRIITNGLMLDKYIDQILESGLVNLFVSLDAFSEETYSQIRGKGFNKVKENLIKLIEKKKTKNSILPIIRVSFVEMQDNKTEKEEFIKYWWDKVDFIDIQIYDNYNIDVTNPFDKKVKKKWSCKSPWSRLSILANGNVLPCCCFFGWNIPIGNINVNTIEEIWNSEKLEIIRDGISNDCFANCSICQRVG